MIMAEHHGAACPRRTLRRDQHNGIKLKMAHTLCMDIGSRGKIDNPPRPAQQQAAPFMERISAGIRHDCSEQPP